jgi:hypothetical protein
VCASPAMCAAPFRYDCKIPRQPHRQSPFVSNDTQLNSAVNDLSYALISRWHRRYWWL